MPVTSETVLVSENGNGVKTAFDFAFKIFAEGDLSVFKELTAGVFTPQVLTTDYTVSFDTTLETGTVTYVVAPINNLASVIVRATARTQGTSFPRETVLPEAAFQDAFDKLTLEVQELSERLDRSAVQPVNPALPDKIDIVAPVDSKGLKWRDNTGSWSIVSTTLDADAIAAAADASATAAAASATAAAASAAAALVSELAAAASAASVVQETSGLQSARPVAPLTVSRFYGTDYDMYQIYSVLDGKWFIIG